MARKNSGYIFIWKTKPPNTVVVIPPAEKYGIKSGDKTSEADAEHQAELIYRDARLE